MSSVTYGGSGSNPQNQPGIKMELVHTRVLQQQPVYDRASTYLYTRCIIEFNCILNPALNAYLPDAGGIVRQIAPAINQWGPTTVAGVRYALSQPRRQLIVVMGDGPDAVEVLRSPPNGVLTDATNGPTVIEPVTVNEVVGGKSLRVRLVIQTDINESRGYPKATGIVINPAFVSPLLSHTWTMTEDIDMQGFSVRTVQGRAVFRRDRLLAMQAHPDDFRGWLLHPIPNDTQRENVKVVAEEDGLTVMYSFQDRVVYTRIVDLGIAHIEGEQTISIHRPGETEVAYHTSVSGINLAINIANQTIQANQASIGLPATLAALIPGIAAYTALSAIEHNRAVAPMLTLTTTVTAYGYPNTGLSALSIVANRVAASRTSGLTTRFYCHTLVETRQLNKPIVNVTSKFTRAITAEALGAWVAGGIANGITQPLLAFLFPDSTVADGIANIMTFTSGPGKALPSAQGTKGYFSAIMVARELMEANVPRVSPTDPPAINPQTP